MRLCSKSAMSLLAAAVMAVSPVAAITAEASSSLGQQYNNLSSFYSSILGNNSTSTTSSKTNNTSSSSGPASSGTGTTTGSQNGVIVENRSSQNSSSNGSTSSGSTELPTKQTVTLSENYYEDYDIYEEGINGLFYFYSNIGNGGVTNKTVYVDFPANITYTAELDGQPLAYTSKQVLSTKGTYVFRIKAIYTPDTALSQQCEYQTTFRFRIQDKVVKETQAVNGTADNGSVYTWGGSSNSSSNSNSSSSVTSLIDNAADIADALSSRSLSLDYITKSISSGAVSVDQMADMLGATPEALRSFLELTKDNTEDDSESETATDESQGDESSNGEDEESGEAENTGISDDDAMIAAAAAGRGTGSGIVESIDSLTGQYAETLLTGTSFTASVQNGATVNGTVSFSFPSENTLVVEATRNGKPYEYTPGTDFTESGWYCLDIRDTVAGYEETYSGKEKPKFYFQIINDPVKDLDILFVPQGEAVSSFTWDGREQKDQGTWVSFLYDGTYVLTYTTASGKNTTVTINKDTRPPQISVAAKNGRAEITTNETTKQLTVYKNGEEVEFSAESQIKGKGQYQVYAVDEAGNSATITFKLGAGISASSVIAVLLILILIGGGVAYVIHIKKNTSMR